MPQRHLFSSAYQPAQIARRVAQMGVAMLNLAVVSGGNIVGGSLLVAGVYWLAYLRHGEATG